MDISPDTVAYCDIAGPQQYHPLDRCQNRRLVDATCFAAH
jgi:hypothetical protein